MAILHSLIGLEKSIAWYEVNIKHSILYCAVPLDKKLKKLDKYQKISNPIIKSTFNVWCQKNYKTIVWPFFLTLPSFFFIKCFTNDPNPNGHEGEKGWHTKESLQNKPAQNRSK